MNNAKMWLVVPPAVGVPLFLGAVAVSSFAVHVAVVSNTSWVDDFLQGKPLGSGDEMAAMQVPEQGTVMSQASYALELDNGAQEIVVILPDGTTARAVMQPKKNEVLAAGQPLMMLE